MLKFLPLFLLLVLVVSGPAVQAAPTLEDVVQSVQHGDLTTAGEQLRQLLRRHPGSARAHFLAAQIAAKAGNYTIARRELARAQELAPGLPFASPAEVQQLFRQLTEAPPAATLPAGPRILDNASGSNLVTILIGVLIGGLLLRALFRRPGAGRAPTAAATVAAAGQTYRGAAGAAVTQMAAASSPQRDRSITLSNFTASISAAKPEGIAAHTALACVFAVLLAVDCLALIRQTPLEQPLFDALAGSDFTPYTIPAILVVQGLIFMQVLRFLRTSTLHRQMPPTSISLLQMGVPWTPAGMPGSSLPTLLRVEYWSSPGYWRSMPTALRVRYAVLAGIAALLYAFMASVPRIDVLIPLSARVLNALLLLGLPLLCAWLLTVLCFRARSDRAVRTGLLVPLVGVIIYSVLIYTDSSTVHVPLLTSQIVWFRLLELALVGAVVISLVYTIVSDPANRPVFKLTPDPQPLSAPLLVEHTPIGATLPSVQTLMFSLGEAQVLAFTSLPGSPDYEVLDTTDEHLEVPLHDRSIKLWNITRLLATLAREIRAVDARDLFSLQVVLGKLPAKALGRDAGVSLSRRTVDAAATVLLKNNADLIGLIQKSVGEAFNQHIAASRYYMAYDRACDAVQKPDISLQALPGWDGQSAEELGFRIAEYERFQKAGLADVYAVAECQKALRDAEAALRTGPPGTSAQAVLEQSVLRNLTDKIRQRANDVDSQETVQLLEGIGFGFNSFRFDQQNALRQLAQQLDARRLAVQAWLLKCKEDHTRAVERLATLKAALAQTAVSAVLGTPGVVTGARGAEILQSVMAGINGGRPVTGTENPPPSLGNEAKGTRQTPPDPSADTYDSPT